MTARGWIVVAALLSGAAYGVARPGFTESVVASVTQTTKECEMNALERSACMIEMILADIKSTYQMIPGGGIGQIRQNSTTSYSIELLREEHVDVFTYEFGIDGGTVTILTKVEE